MSFTPETLDQIKDRISIVELIGESVQLKRSGARYSGLCPFHSEKSPSFFVREAEGHFHCFGCGKSGTIFDFVMFRRGLTFPEAVKFLAHRAGIVLPATSREERGASDKRKELRVVAEAAAESFSRELLRDGGGEIAEYFSSRGLSPELIKKFRLGACTQSAQQFVAEVRGGLTERGVKLDDLRLRAHLQELGLVRINQSGELSLVLSGRAIFPISRSDGGVIAFGGRIIVTDPKRPKYLNSRENPLYLKRRTFYGLEHALEAVRKESEIYLVEGYFDVLGLMARGIENVVATCGTAVTPEHANLVSRFCKNAVLVFDGDSAGRTAAARSFSAWLNSGVDVQVVFLQGGEDPHSLAMKSDLETIKDILHHRVPLVDALLEVKLEEVAGGGAALVSNIAKDFVRLLIPLKNPVERELLLRRAGEKLGVSSGALFGLYEQLVSQRAEQGQIDSSSVAVDLTTKSQFENGGRGGQRQDTIRKVQGGPSDDFRSGRSREWVPREQWLKERDSKSRSSWKRPEGVALPRMELNSRELFVRHLLISALCEPTLVAQYLRPEHAVWEVLGETEEGIRVRELLNLAEAGRFPAISEEGAAQIWGGLLTDGGFSTEILTEALKISRLGNIHTERFESELSTTSMVRSVRKKMQEFSAISGGSEDLVVRRAQDKLLTRRGLEGLRTVRSPHLPPQR